MERGPGACDGVREQNVLKSRNSLDVEQPKEPGWGWGYRTTEKNRKSSLTGETAKQLTKEGCSYGAKCKTNTCKSSVT